VARFGIIPAGTGGDLGRTLGTPRDIEQAAQKVAGSPGRLIDAGRITHVTHDGQPARGYFINAAGAGVGGLVDMYAAESSKLFGGRAAYFWASLRGTLHYKNALVRVRIDDKPAMELRAYLIAAANGGYFGAGMHVAPGAAIDDGLLDVVLIGDLSFPEKVNLGRHIYAGTQDLVPARAQRHGRADRCYRRQHAGPPRAARRRWRSPRPLARDVYHPAQGPAPARLATAKKSFHNQQGDTEDRKQYYKAS
jgi:diacylglycerol kinase family enzyme